MSSSFIGKVLDNYRILEKLGTGGMGVVFKAIHIKLDKVFALKIIAPGLAMNEHFSKRFQTEAKALAKFEDPNIVRIYDLRTYEDQWFIVMEYVEGSTLTDRILKDGAFQWLEALPIMKQVLNAIGHAHESGIIHRDIKPNNIMLSDKGVVKITDFGLAKDQTKTTNTMSITSGGTLFYMSPEHVKGFSFIDARSDLYSVGMTFYEMLTGTVPFKDIKSDFDIRESIVRKEFDHPRSINPDIPIDLETIVMRSISKNPDDRYQSADDMMTAVQDFETNHDNSATAVAEKKDQSPDIPPIADPLPAKKDTTDPVETAGSGSAVKKYPVWKLAGAFFLLAVILIIVFRNSIFSNASSIAHIPVEEKILSTVSISSQPDEAWILLDADSLGKTPIIRQNLLTGQYTLRIGKKNFNTIDTTISVTEGVDLDMEFRLQQKMEKSRPVITKQSAPEQPVAAAVTPASVSIQSIPLDSEVWLNGQFKGKTPLRIAKIKPGSYVVVIRREGYDQYRQSVKLVAGNPLRINASLSAHTGGISVIKNPPTAKVILDGEEVDTLNTSVLNLNAIRTGKHQIEVSHPDYSNFKQNIQVLRNKRTTVNAKLVRLEGNLNIQVRPWGAIYIDDQLHKSSADIKYTIRLPVEKYDVRIEHPTLGSWRKRILLKADDDVNLLVNFNKQISIQVQAIDKQNNQVKGEIVVDGEQTGQITPALINLGVGLHRISVKKEGFLTDGQEKEILVDTEMNSFVIFELQKNN